MEIPKLNQVLSIALFIGLLFGLLFYVQHLKNRISDLETVQPVNITKHDTIYRNKPYVQPTAYHKVNIPDLVIISQVDTVKPYKVDSLVGMTLTKETMSLSLIKDSSVHTNQFEMDLDNYKYIFVNGQLTYKKIPFYKKLKPYVEASYRPFNILTDLSAGILFETKKLNYKVGVNAYYYPKFSKSIGEDLNLTITYKFY